MSEHDDKATRLAEAARHYEAFLGTFGSLGRDELTAAGRRVAELMEDWTLASREPTPTMSLFPAPPDSDWVAMSGIDFYSLCEHHLLPFFGTIDVAVLPGETVAGFSSIVRLIEHICRRPQLQEGLVAEIADALEEALAPRGVLVRLSARQLCMEMRGRGAGVACVSVAARGVCRAEAGRQEALYALGGAQHSPVTPLERDGAPVLLVGAGVAGVSCALWLKDFGVPFVWIDQRGEVGGHLRWVYNPIANYVGIWAKDGKRFVERLEEQLAEADLKPERRSLDGLMLDTRQVKLDGASEPAGLVVVATGVRPRRLTVPGADALGDRLHFSSNQLAKRVEGRRVAIVGGGDGALEGSLNLVEGGAASVVILQRSELRARAEFVEAARESGVVTIETGVLLRRIAVDDGVVTLEVDDEGRSRRIEADEVLVKIGFEPVLPPVRGVWQSGGGGHPVTDEAWRLKSADWVYVIGDASSSQHQTIAHAVAQGATVAMDIARRLDLFV